MKKFTHYHARSVRQAVDLLNKYNGKAKVNAGGSDLLGILKEKSLPVYPEAIINIKTVPGLAYIKEDETGIRIGALTRLADIVSDPIVTREYRALAEAAESVATPGIRNMCTIGGNLAQEIRCWYYRYPRELGGPITCLRKGGKICNALTGDNRYHSVFGAAAMESRPCSEQCPAGTDIPTYLEMVKGGHFLEAAKQLVDFNPIPAVTGRVCPAFCETECNRSGLDEPVAVRCVERSVGDYALEHMAGIYKRPENELGTSVAVIGSGPAGLSGAYYLRRSGYRVTIFERLQEPGGMLLHAIPGYRLPKEVVKKQVSALEGMGVSFECGTDIGKDVSLSEFADRFDAVFLAAGAWKEKMVGIKGESLLLSGLQLLQKLKNGTAVPGRKVGVVGGGNVAIDVARTLRRLGAEPTVIYRRSRNEMPAFRDEVEKAEEEGVRFQFLTAPQEAAKAGGKVRLSCLKMKLGAPDASGRRQPVPRAGSDFIATFDAVIKAIGEEPETGLLPAGYRRQAKKSGPSARLLDGNLFAGGDFISGPSTVIEAIRSGREAAGLIDRMFGKQQSEVKVTGRAEDFTHSTYNLAPRLSVAGRPADQRIKGVDIEDVPSAGLDEVEREAGRCVSCGCLAVGPSDIGVALVALGAKIVTTKRTVDAPEFFTTHALASNLLETDEIITEIIVPKNVEGTRQSYVKFTLRKPVDFAIVSVATVITEREGTCSDARIALGALAPAPFRAVAAEDLLKGKPISETLAAEAAETALAHAWPVSMNGYKIEIAKALIRRAILGTTEP